LLACELRMVTWTITITMMEKWEENERAGIHSARVCEVQ
jgi:hypothetical protein